MMRILQTKADLYFKNVYIYAFVLKIEEHWVYGKELPERIVYRVSINNHLPGLKALIAGEEYSFSWSNMKDIQTTVITSICR